MAAYIHSQNKPTPHTDLHNSNPIIVEYVSKGKGKLTGIYED